jgi:hypothetical protein
LLRLLPLLLPHLLCEKQLLHRHRRRVLLHRWLLRRRWRWRLRLRLLVLVLVLVLLVLLLLLLLRVLRVLRRLRRLRAREVGGRRRGKSAGALVQQRAHRVGRLAKPVGCRPMRTQCWHRQLLRWRGVDAIFKGRGRLYDRIARAVARDPRLSGIALRDRRGENLSNTASNEGAPRWARRWPSGRCRGL